MHTHLTADSGPTAGLSESLRLVHHQYLSTILASVPETLAVTWAREQTGMLIEELETCVMTHDLATLFSPEGRAGTDTEMSVIALSLVIWLPSSAVWHLIYSAA